MNADDAVLARVRARLDASLASMTPAERAGYDAKERQRELDAWELGRFDRWRRFLAAFPEAGRPVAYGLDRYSARMRVHRAFLAFQRSERRHASEEFWARSSAALLEDARRAACGAYQSQLMVAWHDAEQRADRAAEIAANRRLLGGRRGRVAAGGDGAGVL